MKKQYELTIINGENLPPLLISIITNHNTDKSKIDLDIIECHLLAVKAAFPNSWKNILIEQDTNNNSITVSENETILFYIQEKEIFELEENPDNLSEIVIF